MLRGKALSRIWSRLAAPLISFRLFVLEADAGNPVTVQLYSGASNPVYVSAGSVTINFSYFLVYGGKGVSVGGYSHGVQADSLFVFSNSGDCWLRYR
jgi:hypothetical protein